jgi:hypothetical protein
MFQPIVEKLLNIEEKKFIENSFKSKLKIIEEVGCTLGLVGKPLVDKIQQRTKTMTKTIYIFISFGY